MSLLQELVKKVKPKDKLFSTSIQFLIEALCSVHGSEDERRTKENKRQGQSKDDDIKHKCEDIFYKIEGIVEEAVEKEFYLQMSSYLYTAQLVKELEVIQLFLRVGDE